MRYKQQKNNIRNGKSYKKIKTKTFIFEWKRNSDTLIISKMTQLSNIFPIPSKILEKNI